MRSLLALLLFAAIAFAADNEDAGHEHSGPIGAERDEHAYLAFRLRGKQLQQRVQSAHHHANLDYENHPRKYANLSDAYVHPDHLELRIISFYYDRAAHKARNARLLVEAMLALCTTFPRYLTFDKFVRDHDQIRAHAQDINLEEDYLRQIVSNNGFTHREGSDLSRGNVTGFVVVKRTRKLTSNPEAEYVFRKQLLRSSVYVDRLTLCVDNDDGECEEIASQMIRDCPRRCVSTHAVDSNPYGDHRDD